MNHRPHPLMQLAEVVSEGGSLLAALATVAGALDAHIEARTYLDEGEFLVDLSREELTLFYLFIGQADAPVARLG